MHGMVRADEGYLRSGRLALLFLCGLTFGSPMRAQVLGPSNDLTVHVHGVVLNAVTLSPVGRALVTTLDQQMAVMTDDKGRFEFEVKASASGGPSSEGILVRPEGITAAYLTVKKPGYRIVGPPSPISVKDPNALKAEVRLLLMPEATLAGSVSASSADLPLGMNVQLLRRQVQDGAAMWQQVETQQVDARGRYRFGGLMPGDYKIVTAEWTERLGPFVTTSGKPMTGYPPQAYPNGVTPATAGVIHVGGGQNIEADVNVRAAPYYTVEVPILNSAASPAGVAVESENGPGYSLGYNARTQRLEGALPDGTYHLSVTQNGGNMQAGAAPNILVGMGELTVAGKPVRGTPIACARGATVPVTIRQEFTRPDPNEAVIPVANAVQPGTQGPTAQPQPEAASAADGKAAPRNAVITAPRMVDVFLAPKDGNGESGFASYQQEEPGKEGTTLQNVLPGRYKVLTYARRGYVASITANGLNLMHEPLVVEAGAAAPAIEIVLRDDSATITGSISGAAAKEAASPFPLLVWAFPVDDGDAARPSAGSEEPNGKFTIPNVVPGRYLVLAFSGQAANLEYRNKDVMKAYEPSGVIVSLLPGQTLNVELKAAITYVDWAQPEEED